MGIDINSVAIIGVCTKLPGKNILLIEDAVLREGLEIIEGNEDEDGDYEYFIGFCTKSASHRNCISSKKKKITFTIEEIKDKLKKILKPSRMWKLKDFGLWTCLVYS